MKIFYVVYLPDDRLRLPLDAIRVIGEGKLRWPAHITVRGPYSQVQPETGLMKSVAGSSVQVDRIGTFFDSNQNTVFLNCDSTELREAWYKDAFGYHPHITIYDGESRVFAKSLVEVLNRYPIRFHFTASGLSPLVSAPGHFGVCPNEILQHLLINRILQVPINDGITGNTLNTQWVAKLDQNQRLYYIERLCKYLLDSNPHQISNQELTHD